MKQGAPPPTRCGSHTHTDPAQTPSPIVTSKRIRKSAHARQRTAKCTCMQHAWCARRVSMHAATRSPGIRRGGASWTALKLHQWQLWLSLERGADGQQHLLSESQRQLCCDAMQGTLVTTSRLQRSVADSLATVKPRFEEEYLSRISTPSSSLGSRRNISSRAPATRSTWRCPLHASRSRWTAPLTSCCPTAGAYANPMGQRCSSGASSGRLAGG